MSKYTKLFTFEGLLDAWIEFAVVALAIAVVIGIIAWIISKFWLWILISLVVVAGGYIGYRVWRHRRDYW